jgi:hypothetical protein
MEFDHVTNRYLYPDRYIKMIPYFLNIDMLQNPLSTYVISTGSNRGKDG